MRSVIGWFRREPHVKIAWIQAILGILTLGVNTWVIVQNSSALSRARDSLYLSVAPTVDLEVREGDVLISNRGIYPVHDVRWYVVNYKLLKDPPFIRARSTTAGNHRLAEHLSPGDSIMIPSKWLTIHDFDPLQAFDGYPARALVLTFRRHLDFRKFMAIEVFLGGEMPVPLFQQELYSISGPWPQISAAVPEIERTERFLFRIPTSGS